MLSDNERVKKTAHTTIGSNERAWSTADYLGPEWREHFDRGISTKPMRKWIARVFGVTADRKHSIRKACISVCVSATSGA
jgi:hypothetical protein